MTRGAKRLAKLFDRPTQTSVARQLKIDPSYLSLLIAGQRIPSMALAARIQEHLGIPVNEWVKK